MPILNYTTDIPADKTVEEIQRILRRAGAASIRVDYHDGQPENVLFALRLGRELVEFRVPSRWQGVYSILLADDSPQMRPKYRSQAHARRVAWRIVKDWIEAQIALVQSGQATLPQLFLPHAVRADGKTLFEVVAVNPQFLLAPGGDPPP
jgi:hypothetical protein